MNCQLKCALFLLLGLYIRGGDDVVQVGRHKGLDLRILLLCEQLLKHLDVTVGWVPHQDQVRSQALLYSTLVVLGDPLEVRANLDRKATGNVLVNRKAFSIKMVTEIVFFSEGGMLHTSSVTVMRLKA